MGRLTTNQALATAVIDRLRAEGVRTFCVCPGGRNAPLIEVLDLLPAGSVDVLSFFDERGAGFFALGRARRDEAPVAVVTTSGTAAAELLPAMVEAYYSSTAVVAVTADRPRAYRGSGAPQAIEQVNLFGMYATSFVDLEEPGALGDWVATEGPAHINVCFSEPLLADWNPKGSPGKDAALAPRGTRAPGAFDGLHEVESFLSGIRSPLLIVGGLQEAGDTDAAARFSRAAGAPVLAEASSGVRTAPGVRQLRSGDAAAQRGFALGLFDGVIRIGDVPSCRVWRDLDVSLTTPVLSISRKRWPGLTRGTHVHVPHGVPLPLPACRALAAEPDGVQALLEWDARLDTATTHLLETLPGSEPSLVRRLSERIPEASFVYLGNSLPIREWNQFATRDGRRFTIGENRGANGIDGQVASFLGWARRDVENWAIVGDLTALYDLSALWALRHLDGVRLRIVIINNGGGRIFQRMFRNERFQNLHATGFEGWAAMWGAEYHSCLPAGPVGPAAVIELRPDDDETAAFWARFAEEAGR